MDERALMTTRGILERCRTTGLLIWLDGSTLRLESPKGPPPGKLLDALRSHKPGIMDYLRDARTVHVHPCTGCAGFYFAEPATLCYGCRRKRDGKPLGPSCGGCGEACERCIGTKIPGR